jgi:parallel beta-helix repeat protein
MWFAAATYARRLLVFAALSSSSVTLLLVPAASRANDAELGGQESAGVAPKTAQIVVRALGDAAVVKSHPRSNYGSARALRVAGGARSEVRSYVKFRIEQPLGHVLSARLKAYVVGAGTGNGPAVYSTANRWGERRITWRTRPGLGPQRDDVGRIAGGSWVQWDVSAVVRSAGTYSFAVVAESRDALELRARKTRKPPKLVVTTALDTVAPTAPAGLHEESSTESTLSVAWDASNDDVGVVGYRVFRDGVLAGTTAGSAYALTALECGSSYVVGVEAFDLAGNVSVRSMATGRTNGCPSTTTDPAATGQTTTTPGPGVECTSTLAPGGDLSSFVNSLTPGDTGCLRGGSYTDGPLITWSADGTSASPIVLTAVPGEEAEIVGTELSLAGDYLTIQNLTVLDVLATDADGISISGTRDSIEHSRILGTARHGILLHSSARNAELARNFVDLAGIDDGTHSTLSSSQIHGIYVQGSGHRILRNVFARVTGYGIHLYGSPSDILVSGNTAVASSTRTGLLVRTTGSGIVIVDNIFEGGTLHSCGGCLIDTNQVAGGWTVQDAGAPQPTHTVAGPLLFTDAAYRLASGSPAVDAGRLDYAVSPDLDGNTVNGAADLGAYES